MIQYLKYQHLNVPNLKPSNLLRRSSLHLVYVICIPTIMVSLGIGCSTKHRQVASNSQPIQHNIWNDLLQKHVAETGEVNYKGFMEDSLQLNQYLDLIRQNHPTDSNWNKQERLAYWINAYNAFTVKVILDHYPVKSIKDISGSIPFVNTTWDIKFINIEGNEYDLNNLEHSILRKDFSEPRIHFAINCASYSCPRLSNEAYVPERIDEQLDAAARTFINNPNKNKIEVDKIVISKIFSWFKGDFTKKTSLIKFLNKYSDTKIDKKAEIDHMSYNWTLNE